VWALIFTDGVRRTLTVSFAQHPGRSSVPSGGSAGSSAAVSASRSDLLSSLSVPILYTHLSVFWGTECATLSSGFPSVVWDEPLNHSINIGHDQTEWEKCVLVWRLVVTYVDCPLMY
jgi:hypothetical protein